MVEDMVVLSIIVTNIDVVEIEEEGTEVANSASLNCSIVEVVDMDNRVEVLVESSDMPVGLYFSKDASYMFQLHPHSYIWIATQERRGSYLLDALMYSEFS